MSAEGGGPQPSEATPLKQGGGQGGRQARVGRQDTAQIYWTFGGAGTRDDVTADLPPASASQTNILLLSNKGRAGIDTTTGWLSTAYTALLICGWYFFNTIANVENKRTLNMVSLPCTVSAIQMLVSWVWFVTLWGTGIRKLPRLMSWEVFWVAIVPQALMHIGNHVTGQLSFAAGAVSFTHVVKANEPVFTALLSMVLLKQTFSIWTYLFLLPIIFGVALAALKELSFTWIGLWGAIFSALFSALRSVYAKRVMSDKKALGENMTPGNIFSLLTIVSTFLSLPIALVVDYHELTSPEGAWAEGVREYGWDTVIWSAARSGLFFYLYNETAFIALSRIHALTHAVANTLKRVVVIVTTVIVFRNPITPLGAIGSVIAIFGTLVWSIAKAKLG